jgi:uridine kinase
MGEKHLLNFVPPDGRLYMIGIAGPSGSGKSVLARSLAHALSGWSPALISLDAYYKDLAHLAPELRAESNFDHPHALDRELALEQLASLARGVAVDLPLYDFTTHSRGTKGKRIEPGWIVIVEGLFALYWEDLRDLFDLRVFLEAGQELCLERRLARDLQLRGRTEEFVRRQYSGTVIPMFERYIQPTRRYANLMLRGDDPVERSVAAVLEKLELAAESSKQAETGNARTVMSEEPKAAEEKLPPYVIEGARSARSRCRTCRRQINKGALRLGILIEGPYGTGYLWHHLKCAARSQFNKVEEAYRLEAWKEAKDPPGSVPDLERLRGYREEIEERKKKKKTIPYAEVDPSGRAKCKQCGALIEKGSMRVILGKVVEFGSQVRTAPINVHAACVAAGMGAEDCATEPEGFEDALRANSSDLPREKIDALLAEIGGLGSRGLD